MTESVVGDFAPGGPLPTIVIEPAPRWPGINVGELWSNRELLLFLVWRDIKVQYAQTALGAAWAVVQPLMTMLIFTLDLRTTGEDSIGWRTVFGVHARCSDSVDVLFERFFCGECVAREQQ